MQNEEYWESRLTNNLSTLEGVGYSGFGQNFNKGCMRNEREFLKEK